jgi:hypothetical protein
MFESRIKGKRLLGLGMVLTLLVTVGVWQGSVQTGQAQSTGGFNGLKIVVDINLADLATAAAANQGTAFYKEGDAFTIGSRGSDGCAFAGDEKVGTVRIWGVSTLAGTEGTGGNPTQHALAVNVNIDLPGFNGALAGQGTLFNVVVDALHQTPPTAPVADACHPFGDDLIAITGGVAGFRGANGEASFIRQTDGTLVIRLQETKRR